MTTQPAPPRRRLGPLAGGLAAFALLAGAATPARAWVGLWFGYGGVTLAPPPVYAVPAYPMPYAYAPPPPPVYWSVPPAPYAYPSYGYVPPPAPAAPYAQSCRAGAVSCPLGTPGRPGDACSCPTPRGPAWGRVGG